MKKLFPTVSFILLILVSGSMVNAQINTKQISIGELIEYESSILNENVELYIHLPEGYTKERKYPVLYLLDGEYFFTQLVSTVEFLSNCAYVQKELIPKFIIVGIATKDRNKDFTPSHAPNQYGLPFDESGGAENYYKFMKNELFQYIKSNYSISEKRLLTGWSLGGLFTTYCYLNHPEDFDYYLAVSPSFWWDNLYLTKHLENIISEKILPEKKFTITIGELEKNPMASSVKESFVPIISRVADSNYFNFLEIENESHSFSPFKAFYEGLQSIFYRWSMPDSLLLEKNFKETEKFIFELSKDYGFIGDDLHDVTYHLYIVGLQQSNYGEALKVAKFRAIKFSKSVYANYNLCEIYYRLDDKENCLKYIGIALKLEQEKPEPNEDRLRQFRDDYEGVSKEINSVN